MDTTTVEASEKNGIGIGGIIHKVLCLVEDHIELAKVEIQYESEKGRSRVMMYGIVLLCGVSAFVFLHLAILSALIYAGVPLYIPSAILCLGYAAGGAYVYKKHTQRDPLAGEPFQASSEELNRSLQWIHQLLS